MKVKFINPAAAVIPCRILRLSLRAFAAYKAQSAFVVSAVALGISALTIIVAAFDAAAVKADALVKDFGPEAIFAAGGNSVEVPLGNRPLTLTLKDIAAIRTALPGVAKAEPFLLVENVTARAGQGRHEVASVVGTGPGYQEVWDWKLTEGRDLNQSDMARGEKVCLLGTIAAEKLFGGTPPVGRTLELRDVTLTVIGLLETRDVVASGAELDDRIVLPYTTLINRFNLNPEYVNGIRIKYLPGADMRENGKTLRAFLRAQHRLPTGTADDFMVVTPLDILRFVSFLKGGFLVFLGLTAFVSLLVSGFILANLFYLSVSERTVEIGLKKALGASTRHILLQFLFEVLQLTTCGALAGLVLGAAIGAVLNQLDLLVLRMSGRLFVAALAAATFVALAFGLRPALAAARLNPVAALKGDAS